MLSWLVAQALGQDAVDPFQEADESVLFRFEEELVTVASRYAQTVRKAPSIVTLITSDQIRERGYRNVSEVLRELPGIYVWKSPEGRDLVAVRGVIAPDNNKLLVLVDGVPWYDGVYSHGFVDDYLPISNIRQIEVIKGPGSAIYGTNAFTGVVNIVTWGPQDLEGGRVRVLGGSVTRGDVTVGAGGRGRIGRTETSAVAYARLFGQTGEGLDVNPELAYDVPGTDPKKAVNVGVKLAAAGLRLQVAHVDYAHTYLSNEIEDPFEAQARTLDTFDLEYHDTFFDVRYLFEPRDVQLAPYAFYQRHDNPSSYFFGGDISVDPVTLEASQFFMTVDAEKATERTGAGLDVQARPALDHVVVGGAGVESVRVLRLFDLGIPKGGDPFVMNDFAVTNDCGDPAGLYTNTEDCAPPRLRNLFGYVQYTWTTTPFLELTAGGRIDKRVPVNRNEKALDNEGAFVLALSPRVGALLVPTDDLTVKLLYGRAFRAPAVRELLVTVAPDPVTGDYAFTSGDLNVLPETIDTTEGEVTAALAEGLEVRADASWSVLIDEIDKVGGRYCNLPGNLNVLGLEAGLKVRRGPIGLQADYALTRAQYVDEEGDAICTIPDPYGGKAQYEFPPHMLKGSLRVALTEELSATLFGDAYSARPRAAWSPDAKNKDGAPFGLLHASMRAAGIGDDDRIEIDLAVRNVLGTDWNTGVYRDDADEDDLPGTVQGEGRAVTVGIEIAL